jgi:geranylgeranyl diphosphate synthase type II
MDINTYLKEKKAVVDDALKRYFAGGNPFYNVMQYSLEQGKRIRPILAIASYEASGGTDTAGIMGVACGLELIHTYSLIHDDLPSMDNDDFRRGRESSHKKFGEARAILAGDGLYAYAYELMTEGAGLAPEKMEVVAAISRAVGPRGIVYGQVLDVEEHGELDPKTLRLIHLNKTAKFIAVSIQAGAILARAARAVTDTLYSAGIFLGILFQYTDDILDMIGKRDSLGKTPGKDDKAGKLTALRVYGLDGARFRAQRYAALAKKRFLTLGARFGVFSELTDFILNRTF